MSSLRFTLLILLLVISLQPVQSYSNVEVEEYKEIDQSTRIEVIPNPVHANTHLTLRGPIFVDSDADFNQFSGSGTSEDPYIIENFNITTSIDAITIEGIDRHFIVRNNWIKVTDDDFAGLGLSRCENGLLINNTIIGGGINIYNGSNNNQVVNNSVTDVDENGILVGLRSNFNLVANNTISYANYGLLLGGDYADNFEYITNNTITGNTVKEVVHGMLFNNGVTNSTISHNIFKNVRNVGIQVNNDQFPDVQNSEIVIENNVVNNSEYDGIRVDEPKSIFITVSGNHISNTRSPLQFSLINNGILKGNTVKNNGDYSVIAFSQEFAITDNKIIDSQNIVIRNSHNMTFSENVFDDTHIILDFVEDSQVFHNLFYHINEVAIDIVTAQNVLVYQNLFFDNLMGIRINSASSTNQIIQNDFVDNNQDFDVPSNNDSNSYRQNFYNSVPLEMEQNRSQIMNQFSGLTYNLNPLNTTHQRFYWDFYFMNIHPDLEYEYTLSFSLNGGQNFEEWITGLTMSSYIIDLQDFNDNPLFLIKLEIDSILNLHYEVEQYYYIGEGERLLVAPTIIVPAENTNISGIVTLEWEPGVDPTGNFVVHRIEYLLEGELEWVIYAEIAGSSSIEFNTTALENGEYLIKVMVISIDGLQASDVKLYGVFNEPPREGGLAELIWHLPFSSFAILVIIGRRRSGLNTT